MKISTVTLDKISYIWISIPLFIFLFFWLKPVIAMVLILLFAFSIRKIFEKLQDNFISIKKNVFVFVLLISILWCVLAGIGGLAYQSPDWHVRNAIFRDLINFSFPVKYDNGSMLVYYLGIFLPGSIFGKFFINMGNDFAFKMGNLFMLFYISVGIDLIIFQIIRTLKIKNKQFLIPLIFIFFSGLDIFVPNLKLNLTIMHLERHDILQYSCFTTLLFWVYNQAVAPILTVLLFFKNPYKIANFGFFGLSCLFYSPLVFCGMFIYLAVISIIYLVKSINNKKLKHFFKKVFSVENLLILPVIFTIYMYFKSNASVNIDSLKFILFDNSFNITKLLISIIIFVIFEAGIYFILVFHKFKKNIVFQITIFSLCGIPFFQFGKCADFCMRASIPALTILMLFVIKYLFNQKNPKAIKIFLVIAFLLGSITPTVELLRSISHSLYANKSTLIKDNLKTYNNKIYKENCKYELISGYSILAVSTNYCNYGSIEPEKYFFFKYLAKQKHQTM